LLGKTPLKEQNDNIFQKFEGAIALFAPLATPMIWIELMEFICGIFVVKMCFFVNLLDFIWTWIFKFFEVGLDLD